MTPHPPRTTDWVLANLDPRARIVGALAFAVVVVAVEGRTTLLLALALAIMASISAGLTRSTLLTRLLAIDGMLLAALLVLPATVPGTAWIGLGGVTLSIEGSLLALDIGLRASAVMLMTAALIGGLDPAAFSSAVQRLGVPPTLVQILHFTLRYLEVFQREMARLRNAVRARAFRARGVHGWRTLGYLVGMLLVRGHARAERLLAAMRCRGYCGRIGYVEQRRWRFADTAWSLAGAAVLLGLAVVDCR